MTPALLLAALTGVSDPTPQGAHMAPQCFGTMIEAALFLGSGWNEALISAVAEGEGARLTFQGPRTWSEVTGQPGRYCITAIGENL